MPRGRHLLPIVVLAVCLAGAAGSAPAGIGPAPPPKPGRIVSSPYPQSASVVPEAAVAAADGSVAVVGWFSASWSDNEVYRESSLALGRLRPDGLVDASFGDGGEVRDDRFRGAIGGVALDGAGRIVVAGWEGRVPVVARYGPTGMPDGTFGNGGIARGRPEPPGDSMPTTLAARALADGSVVVVSNVHQPFLTGDPAPGGLTVTRLRVDGAPLFRRTHSAPEWTIRGERAYATWAEASIQADGSVVVVGHVADPAPYARGCDTCELGALFVMRRFGADGTVDRALGTAGRTMMRIGQNAYAADLAVAPDGAIVVGGGGGQTGRDYAAARFGANGKLDRSFGDGGVFVLPVEPSSSGAQRVVLTPDGGVVLAGGPGLTLVRVDRDGRIVPTFGAGGRAPFDGVGSFREILPAADGSLRVVTTTSDRRLRLVQLDVTGRATGETIAELPMSVPSRGAHAGVVLRRGGIVLAGWIDTGAGIAPHLVRTGSPSASRFGSKARVTLALGTRAEATATAEWPDGSLLAAGTIAAEGGGRWFVGKLTSKGELDSRFGANGIAVPLAPAPGSAVVSAVALADGRSLILGRSDEAVLLVRLLDGGVRDDTFGDRGVVALPLDGAAGLVVDRLGRSLVSGSLGGVLAAVALDTTGRPGAPLVAPVDASAAGIAVASDGVVVAGTSAEGVVIARWTGERALDREFGSGGVVRRAGYDAFGIAVQRDGRIVVAARHRATGAGCLLRLLYGGGVDAAFGTDGVACAPSRVVPATVAVGPGALYLAGTAETPRGTDLALTSFEQVQLVQPVAQGVEVARVSSGGAARSVVAGGTHPAVSPDGRFIAYVGDDDGAPGLFVADANGAHRRQVTSSPFEDGSVVVGYQAPVWSRDGRLLAFATLDAAGHPQVSVIGADGRGLRTAARGLGPSWGPGRQLAYSVDGEARIVDVDTGESRGLGRTGWWPQWSPRGDLILLGSTLVRPDGTTVGEVNLGWASWKPDGTALVGLDERRIVAIDVARMRSRTVATTGVDRRSPTWSRDGRWIAYIRYVGVYQLVIVDARTGRRVVAWRTPGSTFAGTVPVWGRDGVYVGVS